MIPIAKPKIIMGDLSAKVSAIEESGWFSNFGPIVTDLENELSRMLGVNSNQVIVFNSCTSAIAASISSMPGKIVAVPDFTFVGTFRAAQASGKKIITLDVDPITWVMEHSDLEDISLPVMPFGSFDYSVLERTGFKVVDAAASLGSEPDLSLIKKDTVVCFSLHATKVLGIGEGGFAVFGDPEIAMEARQWSNFGIRQAREQMPQELGFNAKMSEVQAAVALGVLSQWQQEKTEWQESQKMAMDLSQSYKLELQPSGFSNVHPYWIHRSKDYESAQNFVDVFARHGISTRVWWPHSMAVLNGEKQKPISSSLRGVVIGLPMMRGLNKHIKQIERALDELFSFKTSRAL